MPLPAYAGGFELISLALLFLFYLAVYWEVVEISLEAANIAGCATLIAILLMGCRALLREDPLSVWGAMFWFRFACVGYYGVGALAPYVSNSATLVYLQQFYFFSDQDLLKTNLINVSAILIVLTIASCLKTPAKQLSVPADRQGGTIYVLAAAFLIIGGVARYLIVLPFMFGLYQGILPSIVSMLAKAYSAGLMLLIIIALRSGGWLLPFAGALIAIELAAGVLTFSKADVLVTLIFVTLAFYHQKPSGTRLALGGITAIVMFVSLVPLITYGRYKAIETGGGQQIATVEQRISFVNQYMEGHDAIVTGPDAEINYSLSRFFYANAQAMAVALYDQGREMQTLKNLLAALVPRFLWPEKPDITAEGVELYLLATGNTGTSISVGLFAEAYGNYGWWGIPILMIPMGLILALLHRYGLRYMREERWLFLPAVLLGVQIGTRVDGHFTSDLVGAPFTVAILFFLLTLVENFLGLNGKRPQQSR